MYVRARVCLQMCVRNPEGLVIILNLSVQQVCTCVYACACVYVCICACTCVYACVSAVCTL